MNRESGAIIGIIIVAAGVLYAMQANATAPDSTLNIDPNTGLPIDNTQPLDLTSIMPDITTATLDQKISAFLAMIRQFESGNDYTRLNTPINGSLHFTDFSKHPWEGRHIGIGQSSASGAYQDIYATWKRLQNKLGLPDFSPASQDAANAELLNELGVITALDNDNINLAMRLASPTWASLPYSTANQHPQPLSVALNTYDNLLQIS